ncbi:glycosyltransferase family 2 protein [Terriglobus aquaticus]|uniref:Glycosyltransferase family 2 protein n=1 Tax=Terriglobus aquaticus TaxID=940139 RepID=A0ABW9KJG9_9BACT
MVLHEIAEWVFFCCLAVIFYAYAGYWLCLRMAARRRPVQTGAPEPTVSVVMAARNEAHHLPAKLANLAELDYPSHLLQIVVVSDGSTDETAEVLARYPQVEAVLLPASGGKALALNAGVQRATGEVLLMLDVRQRVDRDALRRLLPPFADPTVGAVSGELLLENEDGTPSSEALGIYWKIEKAVRRMESESGSVVGVTGAIYLMRRALFEPLPAGLVLDDVLVPMQVARRGYRVLFQPAAVARDRLFVEPGKEFRRKVRTLTGNLQMLRLAPWLLSGSNPLLGRLISHKLLRLIVPFLLVVMLVASAVSESRLMHVLLVLQVLFYGLALVGTFAPGLRRSKLVAIPTTFSMLNVAAAMAFWKFLTGESVWR